MREVWPTADEQQKLVISSNTGELSDWKEADVWAETAGAIGLMEGVKLLHVGDATAR